jgi:hypothetical protein
MENQNFSKNLTSKVRSASRESKIIDLESSFTKLSKITNLFQWEKLIQESERKFQETNFKNFLKKCVMKKFYQSKEC